MRRTFCLAFIAGLLFQLAPGGLQARALARHAAPVTARHGVIRPVPNAARSKSLAALNRARRRPVHLHLAQPLTTALLDPVPRGRFPFPPPLKGSHDSLLRQNVRSNAEGLARIQDDEALLDLRRGRELVAIPVTNALLVDERLPANRRYCRQWTAQFLSDLSRVHYGRFRRPLQVNSAVRTVEYQRHLELVNGNAAPADGDDASPHLTGATIDIAKKGLSMGEVGWLRAYLMPLEAAGKLDVEEEFYQSCFHITVYRSYQSARYTTAPQRGKPHGTRAALLATRLP